MPTSRRPSTSCRSRATPSTSRPTGSCASTAAGRGGNEWEPLTKGLPQSDCYVNVLRDAMAVDSLDPCGDLLRHHRRTGLRLGRRRRQLDRHRARPPGRALGRGPDAAMIRVVLPFHLRNLARVGDEVEIEVSGPPTQRAVLDALEAEYPVLRGTIRDHGTAAAPPVPPLLRLRAGSVARAARLAAARAGRPRGRAVPDRGGYGGRLGRQGVLRALHVINHLSTSRSCGNIGELSSAPNARHRPSSLAPPTRATQAATRSRPRL